MNEDAFFANVAGRLGRSVRVLDGTLVGDSPEADAPLRETFGPPPFWAEYQLSPTNRVQKFMAELASLGGSASLFHTIESLHAALQTTLRELGAVHVGVWGGDFAKRWQIDDVLADYQRVEFGNRNLEDENTLGDAKAFATVDVGITGCQFAVADTGSVVLIASRTAGRVVSLLPSVHIVLLHASQIVTRMGEVWAGLAGQRTGSQGEPWPAAVNFITGPSRSSDIENDLSIGVHGPAAVIAFVLAEGATDPTL